MKIQQKIGIERHKIQEYEEKIAQLKIIHILLIKPK